MLTRVQNHGAHVNIKYNHADSKTTYLISLSCCHEFILNESSILSFKIQVNLCELMTLVSNSNLYKIISLIYIGPCVKHHEFA